MTLALLLTAVGGAWAEETYTVQFKANGKTKTVENITLPYTFKCDYSNENGELDLIIKQLYGLTGGCCMQLIKPSDNENVTSGVDGNDDYITISAPFEGTATVTGPYYLGGGNDLTYSLEISIPGYIAEPAIEVTTDAASKQDLFTTASFEMPAFDATVNYMLVRDMQDETNPVAFSGLPSNDEPIVVKKGSDGKYQPAETLNLQLIDPLAAAEAQNIIAADGITVKVLVGNGGIPIEYDQVDPITLEAFLADMKPGQYWIKAEATDENSPYDGTVYSSEFTAVEQYDLTVKPANDFSKNGLDAVTVGTESVTPDATTGEATKTGIAPDTEVKLKAKRGYVIEKVEAKKIVPAEGHDLTASAVGDIVGSDGKTYAAADKDNLPKNVTAVAMVAYKNGTGGLAIALSDEGSMNFSTAKSTCESKTAISGATWKLPSKNQWEQIFSANGGNNNSCTGLNTAIDNAGGTALVAGNVYWTTSSAMVSGTYYCLIINNGGSISSQTGSPGKNKMTRAILTF